MRKDESVFGLIVRAHALSMRIAIDEMRECGVSPLEAWVLEQIRDDGRVHASEIAKALHVPTSTVTRALWRMEDWGYLTLSKGHYFDARVLRPTLTRMGVGVRKSVVGFEYGLDRMLLEEMRPALQGAMSGGLIQLIRTAERLEADLLPEATRPKAPAS